MLQQRDLPSYCFSIRYIQASKKYGKCQDEKEERHVVNYPYSESTCRLDCYLHALRNECGCLPAQSKEYLVNISAYKQCFGAFIALSSQNAFAMQDLRRRIACAKSARLIRRSTKSALRNACRVARSGSIRPLFPMQNSRVCRQ